MTKFSIPVTNNETIGELVIDGIKHSVIIGKCSCGLEHNGEHLLAELNKLKGVLAQHDLCHDLHGKVNAEDFAKGCRAEQRRIYGWAPDADKAELLDKLLSDTFNSISLEKVQEELKYIFLYSDKTMIDMYPDLRNAEQIVEALRLYCLHLLSHTVKLTKLTRKGNMYDAQCGSTVDPEDRRNRAECALCHTVIESKHRHDFVRCNCGAIAVDGGTEYKKRLGEPCNFLPVIDNKPALSNTHVSDMSEDQLNEFLAIRDGWVKNLEGFGFGGWSNFETGRAQSHCPDYCQDINLLRDFITRKINLDQTYMLEADLYFKIAKAPNPMVNTFLAPGHVIASSLVWILQKENKNNAPDMDKSKKITSKNIS